MNQLGNMMGSMTETAILTKPVVGEGSMRARGRAAGGLASAPANTAQIAARTQVVDSGAAQQGAGFRQLLDSELKMISRRSKDSNITDNPAVETLMMALAGRVAGQPLTPQGEMPCEGTPRMTFCEETLSESTPHAEVPSGQTPQQGAIAPGAMENAAILPGETVHLEPFGEPARQVDSADPGRLPPGSRAGVGSTPDFEKAPVLGVKPSNSAEKPAFSPGLTDAVSGRTSEPISPTRIGMFPNAGTPDQKLAKPQAEIEKTPSSTRLLTEGAGPLEADGLPESSGRSVVGHRARGETGSPRNGEVRVEGQATGRPQTVRSQSEFPVFSPEAKQLPSSGSLAPGSGNRSNPAPGIGAENIVGKPTETVESTGVDGITLQSTGIRSIRVDDIQALNAPVQNTPVQGAGILRTTRGTAAEPATGAQTPAVLRSTGTQNAAAPVAGPENTGGQNTGAAQDTGIPGPTGYSPVYMDGVPGRDHAKEIIPKSAAPKAAPEAFPAREPERIPQSEPVPVTGKQIFGSAQPGPQAEPHISTAKSPMKPGDPLEESPGSNGLLNTAGQAEIDLGSATRQTVSKSLYPGDHPAQVAGEPAGARSGERATAAGLRGRGDESLQQSHADGTGEHFERPSKEGSRTGDTNRVELSFSAAERSAEQALQNSAVSAGHHEPKQVSRQAVELSDQLLEHLSAKSALDGKQVTIALKPESLGELRLRIVSEGGRVSCHFVAETESAKAALEASIPQLRTALENQGIRVDQFSVALMANGGAFGWRGGGEGRSGRYMELDSATSPNSPGNSGRIEFPAAVGVSERADSSPYNGRINIRI